MLFANALYDVYHHPEHGDKVILHAMPILLVVLCVLAIAYRYYSAFLAARVAALDDSRPTPAHLLNDGQNYHPTNKWVLFGHHFAAISGAGPLIGPVLAIQYGYFPGLLWLVVGVCLAGAVQDMLVLAASVRRGGKSLAEIARSELGPWASVVTSAAILFIVVIALAGLGFVVVKALGGEEVKLPAGMRVTLPAGKGVEKVSSSEDETVWQFPEGCEVRHLPTDRPTPRPERFRVVSPGDASPVDERLYLSSLAVGVGPADLWGQAALLLAATAQPRATLVLPAKCQQLVPGSSWGTFTIACTIPIALFVGLYTYKIRKGAVVEASLIGAAATLAAVVVGNWIPGSRLEPLFSLTRNQTIAALCGYGFVASVLPVWMLLCPRDYLSSFLKIGTIALLVVGVFVANPTLPCPAVNTEFIHGGPTFPWGGVFPFVFICIMCGAVSGFHALVSSGTTPKMVDRESHVRTIGYGAMLIEGLVGVVALIAAASLPQSLYYDVNVDLTQAQVWQGRVDRLNEELGDGGLTHLPVEERDRRRDLARVEREVGNESLRGRTGGAVTLAVGMAFILTDAFGRVGLSFSGVMKYWYHFAIMFEALFILTTIDTGTRIGRFLVQEAMGRAHPKLGKTDWLPGAVFATAVVTAGWGALVWSGSIDTIWPMFGIANQLLAVIALCLVTTLMVNGGKGRYVWVTLPPMLFVTATTMTAAVRMIPQFVGLVTAGRWSVLKGTLNVGLMVFVMACVLALLIHAASRWLAVWGGLVPVRTPAAEGAATVKALAVGDGEAIKQGEQGVMPPPSAPG